MASNLTERGTKFGEELRDPPLPYLLTHHEVLCLILGTTYGVYEVGRNVEKKIRWLLLGGIRHGAHPDKAGGAFCPLCVCDVWCAKERRSDRVAE